MGNLRRPGSAAFWRVRGLGLLCLSLGVVPFQAGSAPARGEEIAAAAQAYATMPETWGARLSPDGLGISFLHLDDANRPMVYTVTEAGRQPLVTSVDDFDVYYCRWATNRRLLCGFITTDRIPLGGGLFTSTRLVAVDVGGGNARVLVQDKLKGTFSQFQDDVLDWLPDDPSHVLLELPDEDGIGVTSVDIQKGRTRWVERPRKNAFEWRSDGHGNVRLRETVTDRAIRWYVRPSGEKDWTLLYSPKDGREVYQPLGFDTNPDHLLVFRRYDGRTALMREDLTGEEPPEVVYAHPDVDIHGLVRIGKFGRIVGVTYSIDRPEVYYFDERVRSIHDRLARVLKDRVINVVDESWDQRYYLIHAHSDSDPGRYYRFDAEANQLASLYDNYPLLKDRELAERKPIHYAARDGETIPGYLTRRADVKPAGPAVVLPHGGPQSRDDWGFDWLSQYLADVGYTVLQTNFRGSGGFGQAWAGEGGFRNWRRTINDVTDGAIWLAEEGLADPERICIVGWSYGGYAALMSAIEEPAKYRCVVSIAGVTDPEMLIEDYDGYVDRNRMREFIGTNPAVLSESSPLKRVDELTLPVLLFHGDRDLNVPIRHSERLQDVLTRAHRPAELVTYEGVEHGIRHNDYRIDMLTRIGEFLYEHVGREPGTVATTTP